MFKSTLGTKQETREKKNTLTSSSIKRNKLGEDSLLPPPPLLHPNHPDIEYANDPRAIKDLTTKKKKLEDQVEMGIQANEFDIFEDTREQLNPTDKILKEIAEIKEAKENTRELPKTVSVTHLQKKLNEKLEGCLLALLLRILERDALEGKDGKSNQDFMKEQLKGLIKNIERLKGQMVDGHQKPKLLFRFLKDYKKLCEETEQASKISNQSNDLLVLMQNNLFFF